MKCLVNVYGLFVSRPLLDHIGVTPGMPRSEPFIGAGQ
jgi:hypothetical protein